jgi:hypothetical protein
MDSSPRELLSPSPFPKEKHWNLKGDKFIFIVTTITKLVLKVIKAIVKAKTWRF